MSIIHVASNAETSVVTGEEEIITEGGLNLTTEGDENLVFDGFLERTVTVLHVPPKGNTIYVAPPVEVYDATLYLEFISINEDGSTLLNEDGSISIVSTAEGVLSEVIHV